MRQTMAPLKLSRWQLTKLMARTAFGGLPDISFYLLLVTLVIIATVYYLRNNNTNRHVQVPPGLPVVKRNDMHFLDIIKEGREKVRRP